MQRLLLVASMLVALSACSDKSTPHAPPASGASASPAAAATPPELITRDALFGAAEKAHVLVSPDGATLSWVAPLKGVPNLWVAPIDAPDKARAVTQDTGRGIREYFWSHRAGTLLYKRDQGGDENFHLYALNLADGSSKDLTPFDKASVEMYGLSAQHPDQILVGINNRDPKWRDLYRVDIATGKATLVDKNTQQLDSYLADGNLQPRYAMRTSQDGGTEVLAYQGGTWKTVEIIPFDDAITTEVVGLTDDGKTLYLRDSRNRNTSALYAVDTATKARTLLSEDARADVDAVLKDPKTGAVQAASSEYLRREWKALDPGIAKDLQALKSLGPGDAKVEARTQDDTTWIVSYSAAETPLRYYRYDRATAKLTKLFSAFPALEGKPLVPSWPLTLTSRDGLAMVSYLTLPADADTNHDGKPDKPVPMVLFVHGGPWLRDSYNSYGEYTQWFANRGYAVLAVNYRGSTGLGKAFTNAGNGEWAGKMHNDLLDAVQWAVKQGVTTPDNVAIMGGSYGGYASLVGLTFTPDTFKCGVDIVGPANLNTLLGSVPKYWAGTYKQFAKRMGDPATAAGKQWLTERSPVTHVDKIKKPLLIGQGANDPRTNRAESEQIVNAMTVKHLPVTYVLFPDEGHGFHRPQNSKAFNAVAETFLGQCLGGRVQPIGSDLTGSSITVPTGAEHIDGLAEALKTHTQAIRN